MSDAKEEALRLAKGLRDDWYAEHKCNDGPCDVCTKVYRFDEALALARQPAEPSAATVQEEPDRQFLALEQFRTLLQEGVDGFGRVLVATSDNEAVAEWRKRCKEALQAYPDTHPSTDSARILAALERIEKDAAIVNNARLAAERRIAELEAQTAPNAKETPNE